MFFLAALASTAFAHQATPSNYRLIQMDIPMRDGAKLHTIAYLPTKVPGKHPILLERTPYGAEEEEIYGSAKLREKGYIFAYQDVRGQYMSDGTYENVRPIGTPVDESTDTYDTIDYLVKNVPDNNGNIGMWGISYPGFYAAAGAINGHPALKAVSPQAPVSDWFIGDDVHHNGAFFLQDNFDFDTWFDFPHTEHEKHHDGLQISKGSQSAYDFFLKAGSMADLDTKYLKGRVPYWNEIIGHGSYDDYWQARALPPKLKNIHCAVLTVGGWFDAEDMWGALNTYAAIERQNPGSPNTLVMGPWFHGMWADPDGATFGDLMFGMPTADWFRDHVEFPFFERYLRGQPVAAPAEAVVFETGANRWREFPQWPPSTLTTRKVYLGNEKTLVNHRPDENGADAYENDPNKPTPYLADLRSKERPTVYMIADQRWAAKRTDVLTYTGAVQTSDFTVAGPIDVDLWASTTGTDADFVVKVIDVWPVDAKGHTLNGLPLAGFQQLVRADIMRGKFRNSLEHPEPFVPGKPTEVHFKLNDLLHTFLPGHRMMVQIQSSWFPLVDRNPNVFEDIYFAKPEDYCKATIRIYRGGEHSSSIGFGVLPPTSKATRVR